MDMNKRQMRIIVEPSQNTFSGFSVILKWETLAGSNRWRQASFTKWQAAIAFMAIQSMEDFTIHVYSELLG